MTKVISQKWVVFVGPAEAVRLEYCNTKKEAEALAGFHEEQTAVFFCDVRDDGTVNPTTPPEG